MKGKILRKIGVILVILSVLLSMLAITSLAAYEKSEEDGDPDDYDGKLGSGYHATLPCKGDPDDFDIYTYSFAPSNCAMSIDGDPDDLE